MIVSRAETAYAKINLALHVRRRRDDGYHDLETLFAFLDCGDTLTVTKSAEFALDQSGQFGANTGDIDSNLVTRAARLANHGVLPNLRFDLDKQLPVAAGLGGGSADAAATLRLMGGGDRVDHAESLGADVPACLKSIPVVGLGTGTVLGPVENDVAGLACLLVNPGIPLATGPVFRAWGGIDRGPMPKGSAREIMMAGRNDLEAAAQMLCADIGAVLAFLASTRPTLARMSGSGASCFALYEDYDHAASVEARLKERIEQRWWTMLGRLR